MARERRSLIARRNSQLIPRESATQPAWDRKIKRVGGGDEDQAIKAIGTFKRQLITRQGLAADDVAQVISEVLERAKRAGFCVQMGEVETPATWLAPAMLADDPIEPALQQIGRASCRDRGWQYV